MKIYELTYIISPEITFEEAEAKAKNLETNIQSKEGVILKQTNPSAKTLAYPVAKKASGFFGILEFQMEPENLSELKTSISKDKEIIRHMIVIKKPIKIRKEKRIKIKAEPIFTIEKKEEIKTEKEEPKQKIELKDIEQKLDEILGQ